jgi:FkbM family methyltransferase
MEGPSASRKIGIALTQFDQRFIRSRPSGFDHTLILEEKVDDETDWFYFDYATHEFPHLVDCWHSSKTKYFNYLKKANVVVTAGGHIGLYSRFYSKIFKTVYAFEPEPHSFFCLTLNNPNKNVIKIQAALSNVRGLIEMNGVSPMSLQIQNDHPEAFIPTFLIDDLKLKECDLIQLDVENNEYNALLGGKETIVNYKPVIILENGNTEQIVDFLQSLNYKKIDSIDYDDIWIFNE